MTPNVVTWLWPGRAGYTGGHVNRLARAVAAHYDLPRRVICVTDQTDGIDPDLVEVLPDFGDFRDLRSPHGANFPSCYRRLRLFHPDAAQWFGDRFVSLDLDFAILRDLTPLWDRPEPVVFLRDPYYGNRGQYNGSMVLLAAGARPQVWERFVADPARAQRDAARAGFRGSDQAWLSFIAPGEPTWSTAEGVYSYKADVMKRGGEPSSDARMVSFHGAIKPWTSGRHWAA